MTDFSLDEITIPPYSESRPEYDLEAPAAPATTMDMSAFATPLARVPWLPLVFLMPAIFCGLSWASGGIPVMTDTGMLWLLAACIACVLGEVKNFSRRFGMGGIVLFGGTMVWYLHDYMSNWFNTNYQMALTPYGRDVVAKAAFFTCLFIMSAACGLLLQPWKYVVRLTHKIPEPPSATTYFIAILGLFAIGMIPYIFFTRGSLIENIYNGIVGMRSGLGVQFTVGRTGNYNYSWGGYLAQVEEVGQTGGLLAMYYVVMIPGNKLSKVICFLIWLFWALMGFGGGSRGEFLFNILPVAGLVFIRYMTIAAAYLKRFSKRAVLYSSIVMFIALIFVQIQGTYRTAVLTQADISTLQLFKNRGNDMFSEGLLGYEYFPGSSGYASDTFPGATFIMPIPDVIVRYSISWIPRVLWHNKPGVSAVGLWYNKTISGGTAINDDQGNVQGGGSVAPSVSCLAYMGYGWSGVIQIGILFGWLCKTAERCVFANLHKPFALMFSMGLLTWLFRDFRDLTPHDVYPILIGTTVGAVGILVLRAFAGGAPAPMYTSAEAA